MNDALINLRDEYSFIIKEFPIFSNLEVLYNEIKKFIENLINNYEKLNNSYNYKMNNFNETFNKMNNNIYELNRKLAFQKEQNNLLANQSQNKIYEINKNITNLNENNNRISIKLKMLKDFIHNFYNDIIKNYNDVLSKISSKGKFILSKKEIKKFSNNNIVINEDDNENYIKEIIIETERIINNLIEYILYLEEELNTLNNLEENYSKIKNENMQLENNINKLENEINNIKIDNQNKINNLKIKYELSLKDQIKEIENKNNEIIKQLNEQMKKKDEEVINVNKNYNLLYNQYKLLMRNDIITEN